MGFIVIVPPPQRGFGLSKQSFPSNGLHMPIAETDIVAAIVAALSCIEDPLTTWPRWSLDTVTAIDVEHPHPAVVFRGILRTIERLHEGGWCPDQMSITYGNHITRCPDHGFLDAQHPSTEVIEFLLQENFCQGAA